MLFDRDGICRFRDDNDRVIVARETSLNDDEILVEIIPVIGDAGLMAAFDFMNYYTWGGYSVKHSKPYVVDGVMRAIVSLPA